MIRVNIHKLLIAPLLAFITALIMSITTPAFAAGVSDDYDPHTKQASECAKLVVDESRPGADMIRWVGVNEDKVFIDIPWGLVYNDSTEIYKVKLDDRRIHLKPVHHIANLRTPYTGYFAAVDIPKEDGTYELKLYHTNFEKTPIYKADLIVEHGADLSYRFSDKHANDTLYSAYDFKPSQDIVNIGECDLECAKQVFYDALNIDDIQDIVFKPTNTAIKPANTTIYSVLDN